MLNGGKVTKLFILLLFIFEQCHLKSFPGQLAWRMCFLLMMGVVGVKGREQP